MRSLCSWLERSRRRRATLARTIMSTFNSSVCSLSHSHTHSHTYTPTYMFFTPELMDLELFWSLYLEKCICFSMGALSNCMDLWGEIHCTKRCILFCSVCDLFLRSFFGFYIVESTRMPVYKWWVWTISYCTENVTFLIRCTKSVNNYSESDSGNNEPYDKQTHITSQNRKHIYLESLCVLLSIWEKAELILLKILCNHTEKPLEYWNPLYLFGLSVCCPHIFQSRKTVRIFMKHCWN